jgi:GT2 family glycosyltransferase
VRPLTVVVPNWNGKEHLAHCLPSLREQDYPDPLEVIVVDNGSTDGSVELLRTRFPWVDVVEMGSNMGFAVACNRGAQQASGEVVCFLNNDTRVEPDWARELASCFDEPDVAAAGSKILSWDGTRLDFVGGTLSFFGHAHQIDQGEPDRGRFGSRRDILFPCGGSMAARRDVFLESRGFEEDYFIYFEDVDLGWRLWVMGYRVVFCPAAVTYHRLSSTRARRVAESTKVLYERNALRTIAKNYDEDNLALILPGALLLCAVRALHFTETDAHLYTPEAWADRRAHPPAYETVSRVCLAHLVAVDEFARDLETVLEKRAWVQARRKRADSEILPLFGAPFLPALLDSEEERRAIAALKEACRLEELFGGKEP